jgi:Protein of unknown function (DUF732)
MIKRLLLLTSVVIIVLDVFLLLQWVNEKPVAENQFVLSLDAAKIPYPSQEAAVQTAKGICKLLDSGIPLLNVIVGEIGAGAVDSFSRANYLVLSAAMSYCPKQIVPRDLSEHQA